MAPQSPSIRSFFEAAKPLAGAPLQTSNSLVTTAGDGFTAEEIDAVLHPKMDKTWMPSRDYKETDVAKLVPGPHSVTFHGRIANLYDQATTSKKPKAAKGCVKLIVKDDSGAVTVRLWYANIEYNLQLGTLVSIWTPHISNGEHGFLSCPQAPLFTSIFPERDRSCHFMIHDNSDQGVLCKTPLGCREGHGLSGLMTLKNFTDGGYDIADGRLLVCIKSISAKKRGKSKEGIGSERINIIVFDDTADATLTLWGPVIASASLWKPSKTVLLLSNPGWNIDRRRRLWISLTHNTLIDVDPCIADAEWLRNFAQRITRREHVSPPFLDGLFDLECATKAHNQILFTFADLDSFARCAPSEKFIGYLSVVVTQLNIMTLYRRNMLLGNECCGVPVFANKTSAKCRQCEQQVVLNINQRLLGPMVDETGCSETGKLILSEGAWEQLLGRTKDEFVNTSVETLRYLEQRLLFLRLTMKFAWAAEEGDGGVGRLYVWGVQV